MRAPVLVATGQHCYVLDSFDIPKLVDTGTL